MKIDSNLISYGSNYGCTLLPAWLACFSTVTATAVSKDEITERYPPEILRSLEFINYQLLTLANSPS